MDPIIWVIGGALLIAAFVILKPSGLMKETSKAMNSGNIDSLVKKIRAEPENNQATAFNKVVKTMWNSYERPLAASVIKAVAPAISACHIAQYWIGQVLEVEPELASEVFDADFLTEHFRPDIAASCGKAG